MFKDNEEYPIKQEIVVTEDFHEISFSVVIKYGSNDRSESGTRLHSITDSKGKTYSAFTGKAIEGVEIKETDYMIGRNLREIVKIVKISATACPLLLQVSRFWDYSSYTDWEHCEGSREPYSIKVIQGEPDQTEDNPPDDIKREEGSLFRKIVNWLQSK